ncbi:MAG: 50S ribosomal protein L10 [Armatimonadota bacterium]
MPTPVKTAITAKMVDELDQVQAAIVTDYRGLTVEEITLLRKRLRPVGARYQVVKNTLFKRALESAKKPELGDILEGPSAVVFAEGDPVEATKALAAFVKELRKDLPQVKGGFLGDRLMTPADVAQLATLPPREQILGNLVGTLQSPAANVVSLIGAVLQNLVGTIEAYQQKTAGTEA